MGGSTLGGRESGHIESCDFKLISQNVRGLASNINKRKTVFEYLKNNGDIAFLQETHCTTETEKKWINECGCESYFSHGTSNSRGVMIFFSNKLDITVNEKISDTEGRIIILKCEIQGEKFLIYNVYAPNDKTDHKTFLLDLKEKLDTISITDYEYIIGAGDWNYTSENIDRKGGNYTLWSENINIMEEMTTKLDLIDIWRVRRFSPTHRRK